MKKIESLFISISLFVVLVATGVAAWNITNKNTTGDTHQFPETKFASFLAAQHAIYVNDFDTALKLTKNLKDTDFTVVNNTKLISEFLGGNLPQDAKLLREEKTLYMRHG